LQPMESSSDYIRQFLYGPATIVNVPGHATVDISMDERMEGWIGIPHGGISMGVMMDLAMAIDADSQGNDRNFPITAEFRLGGTSIRVGDVLHFDVAPVSGGVEGTATVDRDPVPYLVSSIRYGENNEENGKGFASFMPEKCGSLLDELTTLPSYRNCFVCGIERSHPGLRRQFHFWEASDRIVVSPVGFTSTDLDSFYRFSRAGFVHPLPFLALLDEILGWGGFLLTGSGAVTVRIGFTFYRPVASDEKLIFFGRGDRLRGRASSRLLFWASGGAASLRGDGSLEMVASASGQWYCLQELTQQMRSSLLPRTLMERAFELAAPE
jgi:acyl-coenzyme A thioesterase PaaI-like protein